MVKKTGKMPVLRKTAFQAVSNQLGSMQSIIKYKRNLPHIQTNNATLFVTFRLAGSLPKCAIERFKKEDEQRQERLNNISDPEQMKTESYREQKRQFGRWDGILDRSGQGPRWLQQPEIAKLVSDSLHFFDNKKYALICFCIMPNHVHVVFTPLKKENGACRSLRTIMHSIKSYSANQANQLLGLTGQFWQAESYDHVVRDEEELDRIIQYVVNNPVKAGLVQHWEDWKWTYRPK